MDLPKPVPLRSPRELLGGYILFPRLIDKVRLLAKGNFLRLMPPMSSEPSSHWMDGFWPLLGWMPRRCAV